MPRCITLLRIEVDFLLAVLRRAGVVSTRKEGAAVIYSLRDPDIARLLEVAKRFLIKSLSATEDLLADLRAASGRP